MTRAEYNKKYYASNKDTIKAKRLERKEANILSWKKGNRKRAERWRKTNPEAYRAVSLRRDLKKFGLNEGDYNALLVKQDYKCAICGRADSGSKRTRRLAVDHDHSTGVVRGLLCDNCNRAIGLFKDDPNSLQRAASYLRTQDPFCIPGA